MSLNLDLKNDNGMNLSLPSSNNTFQSGTPQETNCERLQALATDIKKFTIIIENIKSMINDLRTPPGETNENKIDRERQRAGASKNEWQRGTEANMRKKPKTGEGRGNKRRQSQPGRDVGGAKHETGRNGQNDKRHGRERTEAGAKRRELGTKQD
ncbi:hypothetical protein TNCV_1791111 [Trichonephila clavipes]|nr:hypothetical protein TNCV_1791111 [Trichonephila clavipes]